MAIPIKNDESGKSFIIRLKSRAGPITINNYYLQHSAYIFLKGVCGASYALLIKVQSFCNVLSPNLTMMT